MISSSRPGLLALHASILLLAVNALFAKLIALPAVDITMLRSLFAAVFTPVPHALFAHSMRFFSAKTVGVVACLQVVYAASLTGLVLGEVPDAATVTGGLIVVGPAMVESYHAGRAPRGVDAGQRPHGRTGATMHSED